MSVPDDTITVPRHARLAAARGEFYVGYGKMPPGLRLFTRYAGIALVFAAAGFSLATFVAQTPPPKAGYGPRASLEGVFQAQPYPMLHVAPGEGPHAGQTLALVRPGKNPVAGEKARSLDGKPVQVGGVFTRREGVQIFQVAGGGENVLREADAASTSTDPAAWPLPGSEDLGEYRLSGAIVDPKCFTGAMRPGAGKAHKGCATFCLLSEIPPYFMTRRPFGGFSYYLMTESDGSPLGKSWYRYASDPIAVTGRVERNGGMLVFKADERSVERL